MSKEPFYLPSISATDTLAEVGNGATLIDLRKPEARTRSGRAIRGAQLKDPFAFGHDDPMTSAPGRLIAFCVHGHEVSQYGCALLLLHGRDVAYVEGGFEALVRAGAPLEDLPR